MKVAKTKIILIVILTCLYSVYSQNVPSLEFFLAWLLDVTSTEITNIANNFNFRQVAPNDIKFIYLAPKNQTITLNAANSKILDFSKPTKFIIHGWQAAGSDVVNANLSEMYHKRGSYNVVAVDWSDHSKKIYMHASSSTKEIGNLLADFIVKNTQKNLGFLDNVHLIGHSLGAHVAGFAGKRVKKDTGRLVGRITGLDVAAPLFEVPRKLGKSLRLSEEDAQFVDVIHTNAGFLGFTGPLGTADFYVENGGPFQPGCFDPINIFESFACSHFKSFDYFLASISGEKLESLSCPNSIDYHILACNSNQKALMGEDVPKTAKGTYYLEADSPLPYSSPFDDKYQPTILLPKFLN